VYKIASSINIPHLLEQAPRRLLSFSRLKCGAYSRVALIRGRRLFEGGAYLKIGRGKKKAENRLLAQVTGKRNREVGLVVPAKFTAFTTELRIARILDRTLNGRAVKYN